MRPKLAVSATLAAALLGLAGGTGPAQATPSGAAAPAVDPLVPGSPQTCTGSWNQVSAPYPLVDPPEAQGIGSGVGTVSKNDVWFAALGANPLFAGFYLQLQHYDGHTVSEVDHPRIGTAMDTVELNNGLDMMSFDSPNDGWLVGNYLMNEEVLLDDAASKQQFPYHPVVKHWNGHRWILTPIQQQPDARFDGGVAKSVLAFSPSDAWLVGTSSDGSTLHALIEHWDGHRWLIVPQPAAALTNSIFYSVAGTSTRDIWAVGRYFAPDGSERPITEHWDGRVWTIVPNPDTGDRLAVLTGVSARTPTDVWAVGSRRAASAPFSVSLVLHWDGRSWSQAPGPGQPGVTSSLISVRAFGRDDVYTTGFAGVQHWDGTAWSTSAIAGEPSFGDSYRGIGGTGPADVWAVGDAQTYSVLAGGGVTQTRLAHRCVPDHH
ncbi:MAG TPA: hypothetical protein VMU51_25965 [Mycobacteriales bacterium]|nr:hypothetical protein [Mycobacteriales bacterium]